MGGVTKAKEKERIAKDKMVNRPQKLKSVRDTFESHTGRKADPVSGALMYKDFTALEKRRYAALEAKDKKKKTLLG